MSSDVKHKIGFILKEGEVVQGPWSGHDGAEPMASLKDLKLATKFAKEFGDAQKDLPAFRNAATHWLTRLGTDLAEHPNHDQMDAYRSAVLQLGIGVDSTYLNPDSAIGAQMRTVIRRVRKAVMMVCQTIIAGKHPQLVESSEEDFPSLMEMFFSKPERAPEEIEQYRQTPEFKKWMVQHRNMCQRFLDNIMISFERDPKFKSSVPAAHKMVDLFSSAVVANHQRGGGGQRAFLKKSMEVLTWLVEYYREHPQTVMDVIGSRGDLWDVANTLDHMIGRDDLLDD